MSDSSTEEPEDTKEGLPAEGSLPAGIVGFKVISSPDYHPDHWPPN